jgi:hypothetical protein
MPWVRIHDGALTHPKIVGLSDKAFRLWVWGLSYSQQHLTNGYIPLVAIPGRLKRATEDLTRGQLWDAAEAGFRVHDYLDWNDSRELVTQKRSDAKERMAIARDRRHQERRSHDAFARTSQNVQTPPSERTSHEVLRRVGLCISSSSGSLEGVQGKPDPTVTADVLGERAHNFLDRYSELYTKYRHGAKLRLMHSNLDFQSAVVLCQTWTDERLEKLAIIVLTTDEDWVSKTDRSFAIFVKKASWADGLLAEAEAKRA